MGDSGARVKAPCCNAIGCAKSTPPRELFCNLHRQLVASDTAGVLARTYRPGERPSKVFIVALDRAKRDILYQQTQGHGIPRDAAFEFSD